MITCTKKVQLKDFIKLPVSKQAEQLHRNGILLDSDIYKGDRINLYYFSGFFAEETINYITWELIDVVPFKKGYRIEKYLKYNGKPEQNAAVIFLN